MTSNRVEKWLTSEGLDLLEEWASKGLTNAQIAENMGIGDSTFYRWLKKHPILKKVIDRGKQPVDFKVENALLNAALGYDYYEEQVTNDGRVVKVQKYKPENVTAIKFWLNNRKPNKWNEKFTAEHVGEIPVVIKDDLKDGD